MQIFGTTVLASAVAYLLGCLDAGYYLVRHHTGADVRDQGSGGTGARNVGRVLGRRGFATVFVMDCLKGVAAVWTASALGAGRTGMAAAAIAVVIGHVFPVQLRFRGGKGASSALGAMLVLTPAVAVVSLLVSAVLYVVSRKATASGVATFAMMPAFALLLGVRGPDLFGVVVITAILLATHRSTLPDVAGIFRRTNSLTRESAR